jgi:hypothetical protein
LQPQRITLTPPNPEQGGSVTICYNFTGSGVNATTLQVTFSPSGAPVDYPVTQSSPCVTIQVPSTALAILVKDLVGPSPDKNAAVIPKV